MQGSLHWYRSRSFSASKGRNLLVSLLIFVLSFRLSFERKRRFVSRYFCFAEKPSSLKGVLSDKTPGNFVSNVSGHLPFGGRAVFGFCPKPLSRLYGRRTYCTDVRTARHILPAAPLAGQEPKLLVGFFPPKLRFCLRAVGRLVAAPVKAPVVSGKPPGFCTVAVRTQG